MLARLRFFLRKIAAWFYIFLQPKVSIGKCKKSPDLVDFQGFVCYKYIEYVSLVGNKFESEHFDMISEQQRQVKIRVISKTDYFFQITASKDNINFYEYFY